MAYLWKKELYVVFDRTFSFMVFLPFFIFFFTHHVDPIIEQVEFDVEIEPVSMVVQVYDPPPLPHICSYD